MRTTRLFVTTAIGLTLALAGVPALAADTAPPADAKAAAAFTDGAASGGLKTRLDAVCKGVDPLADCRTAIETFAEHYRDRAARSQGETDRAALATALSVTALLLGGPEAAATTKAAWSFGAAAPLLYNDLRAPDHRGMLYEAGAQGLNIVSARYGALDAGLKALKAADVRRVAAGINAGPCTELRAAQTAVRAVKEDDSRRTTVLAAIESLIARCDAAVQASLTLETFHAVWSEEGGHLADRAGLDALDVARRIDKLDRALRATPMEAFRITAATPFLTIGGIITGEKASFTGRNDPRDGRRYDVALRALVLPPAIPDELKADGPLPPGTAQALEELTSKRPATFGTATESLNHIPAMLTAWAAALNAERQAALRLAAVDGQQTVDLDPRNLTAKPPKEDHKSD